MYLLFSKFNNFYIHIQKNKKNISQKKFYFMEILTQIYDFSMPRKISLKQLKSSELFGFFVKIKIRKL